MKKFTVAFSPIALDDVEQVTAYYIKDCIALKSPGPFHLHHKVIQNIFVRF